MLIPQPRKISYLPGEGTPATTVPTAATGPQGQTAGWYRLKIAGGSISITAKDAAGEFWAHQTLNQLKRNFPEQIPALEIEDWPDFPVRGFMLDISRDKVPTMQSLFELIDLLANLKINQLQLYTEHTFAYRDHEVVWKDASPMTADEIRQLDSYCRERFIELVPNQNSFGHLERWLKHQPYQHLAEKPEGFTFPSGIVMKTGFSLNPADPQSITFVESLFDELLPNFNSMLFNVGCDETYDIGLGRSKSEVDARGRARVYLDFVLKINNAVRDRGRTMMFWGDIILHTPELLDQLPRDIIALNWGYEADHPFEKETLAFHDAGIPFYVCPGTSSWCSIAGRTDNAIANLKNAAEHGMKNGAAGYLITDWGDYGHLQYFPVTYIGLAAGAAYSWCYESNRDLPIATAVDAHILHDRAGVVAGVLRDLGNVYQTIREPLSNGSRLFWTLVNLEGRKKLWEKVTADEYTAALERIEQAIAPLDRAKLDRPDGELIIAEIRNAAAMLRHACHRGLYLCGAQPGVEKSLLLELTQIISEHRRLWLARNRVGGLIDSVGRLERIRGEYSSTR